jgi:hypothetical protein
MTWSPTAGAPVLAFLMCLSTGLTDHFAYSLLVPVLLRLLTARFLKRQGLLFPVEHITTENLLLVTPPILLAFLQHWWHDLCVAFLTDVPHSVIKQVMAKGTKQQAVLCPIDVYFERGNAGLRDYVRCLKTDHCLTKHAVRTLGSISLCS